MASNATDGGLTGPGFELLVLADFCGQGHPAHAGPVKVDKASFDEVFSNFSPKLMFEVPDRIGRGKLPLPIDLGLQSMADFAPLSILQRVDALKGCLRAARVLTGVTRGDTPIDAARAELGSCDLPDALHAKCTDVLADPGTRPGPQKPSDSEPTGSILSVVGMPGKGESPVQRDVDAFVEQLGIPRMEVAKSTVRQAAALLLEEVCQGLHAQLDDILHDPAFQALESAWRGLRLLVSRTDFHQTSITINVAHCQREAVAEALSTNLQSLQDGGHVVDAATADFAFGESAGDVALLKELAVAGERYYCPVIAAASPSLLGVGKDADYARLSPSLRDRFDAPELIEWRDFRRTDCANYVALVVPDVAGRPPYGPKTVPVADIAYCERDSTLWMRGAWLVATAISQSVARTGWPLTFSGTDAGRVADLPVVALARTGSTVHLAAQCSWTDEQRAVLTSNGLMVIQARPNSTNVEIMSVPTLYDTSTAGAADAREAMLHATLPYRLFANKVAQKLYPVLDTLSEGMSEDEIVTSIAGTLGALFDHPDVVRVAVAPAAEGSAGRQVDVEIEPEFNILGRRAELRLGFGIPG